MGISLIIKDADFSSVAIEKTEFLTQRRDINFSEEHYRSIIIGKNSETDARAISPASNESSLYEIEVDDTFSILRMKTNADNLTGAVAVVFLSNKIPATMNNDLIVPYLSDTISTSIFGGYGIDEFVEIPIPTGTRYIMVARTSGTGIHRTPSMMTLFGA